MTTNEESTPQEPEKLGYPFSLGATKKEQLKWGMPLIHCENVLVHNPPIKVVAQTDGCGLHLSAMKHPSKQTCELILSGLDYRFMKKDWVIGTTKNGNLLDVLTFFHAKGRVEIPGEIYSELDPKSSGTSDEAFYAGYAYNNERELTDFGYDLLSQTNNVVGLPLLRKYFQEWKKDELPKLEGNNETVENPTNNSEATATEPANNTTTVTVENPTNNSEATATDPANNTTTTATQGTNNTQDPNEVALTRSDEQTSWGTQTVKVTNFLKGLQQWQVSETKCGNGVRVTSFAYPTKRTAQQFLYAFDYSQLKAGALSNITFCNWMCMFHAIAGWQAPANIWNNAKFSENNNKARPESLWVMAGPFEKEAHLAKYMEYVNGKVSGMFMKLSLRQRCLTHNKNKETDQVANASSKAAVKLGRKKAAIKKGAMARKDIEDINSTQSADLGEDMLIAQYRNSTSEFNYHGLYKALDDNHAKHLKDSLAKNDEQHETKRQKLEEALAKEKDANAALQREVEQWKSQCRGKGPSLDAASLVSPNAKLGTHGKEGRATDTNDSPDESEEIPTPHREF